MKRLLSTIIVLNFVILSLSASWAFAEVRSVTPYGFIIKNQISVPHSKETVWNVLINQVDNWWPKDHSWWEGTFSITPVAGGCFCERADEKSAEHMRITFVEPGNTLRMSGGLGPLQEMGLHGTLNWVLTEGINATRLTLTYRVSGVYPDGFQSLASIVDKVQETQLNALGTFILEKYLIEKEVH
ncbi:hypothetical protein [Marinibactrum halimedae]|uniref:ATPase n=1 Tax=Marinibactrum halimedae TaxID=1444977 RepID=A0AA37T180_9GAMM|nr:hypothetical protein [Marinibactrum halimedae]MCD9461103.1 hypothetical protein [Marinibactrum halimedae]GLS24443.1 ATPase [Marinibactrum halimedae]